MHAPRRSLSALDLEVSRQLSYNAPSLCDARRCRRQPRLEMSINVDMIFFSKKRWMHALRCSCAVSNLDAVIPSGFNMARVHGRIAWPGGTLPTSFRVNTTARVDGSRKLRCFARPAAARALSTTRTRLSANAPPFATNEQSFAYYTKTLPKAYKFLYL